MPIVATYIYLMELGPYTKPSVPLDIIPSSWKNYRWDAIDILYIDPFVVTKDFTFDLGGAVNGISPLQKRFDWVVAQARAVKPSIRIIAMQPAAPNAKYEGYDWTIFQEDDNKVQITKYTDSLAAFLKSYQAKTVVSDGGVRVSARIDGFDLDYEEPYEYADSPHVLKQIRDKLDSISKNLPFYVSITPADTGNGVGKMAEGVLDYVNMQRYEGGSGTNVHHYLKALKGVKSNQLIYGLDAERPQCQADNLSLQGALAEYDKYGLGGVFIWRLNSNNDAFENMIQVTAYNKIYGTTLPGTPFRPAVDLGWQENGGRGPLDPTRPPPYPPVWPWDTWSWSVTPAPKEAK